MRPTKTIRLNEIDAQANCLCWLN